MDTRSPSKSSCVPFCRKRNLHPDPFNHIGNIQIPVVSGVRFLGVIFDCKLTFLPHVLYLHYGCVVYGSARASILKRLDTIHYSALRIFSGAFRISPVTSLYVHYVHHIWQETWEQQILNKLHSIHPSTSHWAALPVRRHDVRLTRIRIGHTRFTHRHLFLGENAPECPSC
ncbi:uncharacterized protein TNCV_472891 [Trichonephila clavipes]|nr:uncharacterized protein TNCV_472891 [Trichonephila clavipes]